MQLITTTLFSIAESRGKVDGLIEGKRGQSESDRLNYGKSVKIPNKALH